MSQRSGTLTKTGSTPNPTQLLQRLLAFDTCNPPGDEGACIGYIRDLLADAGIPTTILAKDPGRPNLIARLKGRGETPPFLAFGHVDCVTTEGQDWARPPLSGEIADGFIWGRGTLDMKGAVAMMLTALLRAQSEGFQPPGDIVFAALADEEANSDAGARYLVEEHPEQFEGIRYAIGEFGGFSLSMGDRTFYPIMVAEKQGCAVRATVRGPGGHGAMPVRGGAMSRAARLLQRVDRHRLPVHISPPARMMLETFASTLGGLQGLVIRQMLRPRITDFVLDLLGDQGKLFDPLLHNTVSPTMIRGSDKINVIPSEVTLGLDCRTVPGQRPDDLLAELSALLGDDVSLEVVRYDPTAAGEPDMGLFDTLAGILRESDPDGVPIPYLLTGVTDGRFFRRLGIQTYGFTPMQLPPDFKFTEVVHAANERIPVGAVEFGADAIYRLFQRLPR